MIWNRIADDLEKACEVLQKDGEKIYDSIFINNIVMKYLVYALSLLLLLNYFSVNNFVFAEEASGNWTTEDSADCKWIKLNTDVPFVGDCLSLSSENGGINPLNAFATLLAALSSITMTVILIFCFMAVLIWGVLITTWWVAEGNVSKWKDLIKHVVIALALLWASGVILRLINPNFFT